MFPSVAFLFGCRLAGRSIPHFTAPARPMHTAVGLNPGCNHKVFVADCIFILIARTHTADVGEEKIRPLDQRLPGNWNLIS
jgi:hypothetical protein